MYRKNFSEVSTTSSTNFNRVIPEFFCPFLHLAIVSECFLKERRKDFFSFFYDDFFWFSYKKCLISPYQVRELVRERDGGGSMPGRRRERASEV